MVEQSIHFWGIILYLMSSVILDTSSASIESAPQPLGLDPADSTSAPTPVSSFFLCIKITNRDFKESLKNQSSEDYKTMRNEVTQLLENVYMSEPHDYAGISAMTFSEGSVVANTTVMFKTTDIYPSRIKKQFLSYVKKNPPQNLDLNISYTEEQVLPLPIIELQDIFTTTDATMSTETPRLNLTSSMSLNHKSTTPSETTTAEMIVFYTTPLTQTTGSIHATNRDNSKTGSTDLPPDNTTVTTNSPSDDNATGLRSTKESPLTSRESTQLLTHSTRDHITTTSPHSSVTINSTTNLITPLSIFSRDSTTSVTIKFSSSKSTVDSSTGATSLPVTNNSSGATVHPPISTTTTTVTPASHTTISHFTEVTSTTALNNTTPPPVNRTTALSSIHTAHSPVTGPTSTVESNTFMVGTTFSPKSASALPKTDTTGQPGSTVADITPGTNRPLLSSTMSNPATSRQTVEPHTSPTTSAHASTHSTAVPVAGSSSQGVPGWAIALLVLASLILFVLILLVIILLVYCCYKRRQYGFVNMSEDPSAFGQVNHGAGIPMYTTHSHYETPNGKPYEDVGKPTKTRTTYVVNE